MSKSVNCKNKYLKDMPVDVLYHFGLATDTSNFPSLFGDVKFVLMGGSTNRMRKIAEILLEALKIELPCGAGLVDIANASDRYEIYKVGPVLLLSHGMGIPSISILLHELAKLLTHAGCSDVYVVRLGTSGGLGVEPGTVVITTDCMDCCFQNYLNLNILGKSVKRPAHLNNEFVQELMNISHSLAEDYGVISGITMCANDFYEEQGRLDGAICEYSKDEKLAFLKEAYKRGVRNLEMESLGFAAFCQHLNLKAAVVCVTLINRLESDQINTDPEILHAWQERPLNILIEFIKKHLNQ